ncbi:hypothetical protein NKJ59_11050 [Mesorhizobium australicum]|uniref:hypothetical protein n=1 Tax=Mesorhizobium australicum TaxID=536018 RepID=UPI00333DDAE9
MTTAKYYINPFEDSLGPEEDYPREITVAEYDELAEAVEVIDALWFIEEYYDNLLQNAVDFETAVARLEAEQRVNVSSFPDEVDRESRLLNRLMSNFLSTSRSFKDGTPARLSHSSVLGKDKNKRAQFDKLFSVQFDAHLSYRLFDGLRNHVQHQGVAIHQTLTWRRDVTFKSTGVTTNMLFVTPQIFSDVLIANDVIRSATRAEIAATKEPMIDVLPHLAIYLKCFASIMNGTRELYEPEYTVAVASHHRIMKKHISGDWASALIAPVDDPLRSSLSVSQHNLRRLERIRLRNTGRDPQADHP